MMPRISINRMFYWKAKIQGEFMTKKMPLVIFFVLSVLLAPPSSYVSAEIDIDTSSPFLSQNTAKKISMDFQDAPLVNVLKIFSQQSGFNLVTSEDLANRLITVYLDNVPVEEALTQILRANKLTYEIQTESNIYIVKPMPQPEVELLTRVYNLKNSTVTKAKLNELLNISTESESGGGAGGSAGAGGAGGEEDSEGISAAIKSILTSSGHVVEDSRTNSLIVTDIASNFAMIESTIARLDVPIPQILIEVEMLEVSKDSTDAIGIKLGAQPLVFTGAQRLTIYPWDQNRLLAKGYEFEDPEYTAGSVNTSGLTAALQFLRTQTDTKTLARPRIMTLNNETAQIRISTNEAIGIKDQTSSSGNLATSSIEAERYETGIILTVTPQANVDTSEIVLAVIPKFIVAREGGTFTSSSGRQVTFKDPEERGSQSILKIRSGDTIVLGGLLRSDESKTITKLPILGDIPLIGAAFRHKAKDTSDRELIIFITPHIVKDRGPQKADAIRSRKMLREQEAPRKRFREVKIEHELSDEEEKKL